MNVVSCRNCIRNKPCYAIKYIQARSKCKRLFSSDKSNQVVQCKRQDKALRVLDIISSKPAAGVNLQNHLRLIQDFLQTDSTQFRVQHSIDDFELSSFRDGTFGLFDEPLESSFLNSKEGSSAVKDVKLRREEWTFDASVLSHALSSCVHNRCLRSGSQYHSMAVKTGFISNVYVGSSLISLYGKWADLESAYKVFDEMPEKNVVSWTAIIAGFAQEWRIDVCLELYSLMRNSASEPNDFTFTTLLSACTGSGALGQGKSVHCQTIQMGFSSYIHICNALISTYCKCGTLEDAFRIFNQMSDRDVVSWNSMIAGYAQHGLATQAIQFFEEMKDGIVKPDSITFLGILSSCRHAGLVKEGKFYFETMLRHDVKPELDHYSCLVDLLGRFGLLQEALDLIENMPIEANSIIWGSLLSSCRVHGDVWIGIRAAEKRLMLAPECAASHVQLANLYASVGYWDEAARVRKLMKEKGLRTNPGCSWIEIKNDVFRFRAEDRANSRVSDIVNVLDCLVDHMRSLEHMPRMHEEETDDRMHLIT